MLRKIGLGDGLGLGDSHLLVGLIALLALVERLTVGNLLILLDKIAASTAAGSGDIDQAAALEVVLLTDVGALKGHGDPVKSEARRSPEHQALRMLVVDLGGALRVGSIQRC